MAQMGSGSGQGDPVFFGGEAPFEEAIYISESQGHSGGVFCLDIIVINISNGWELRLRFFQNPCFSKFKHHRCLLKGSKMVQMTSLHQNRFVSYII